MPSTVSWVDHDAAARERSLRILAMFQEKESRDELGLGGVRDAFADRLFPGTSTIQTRLRYTLFVPWAYARLEKKRVPASQIAARARELELALVEPLLAGDDTAGVFGKTAGGRLKRLPSSVYWACLGAWGIRRFDGAQDEYHRAVDAYFARRDQRDRRRTAEDDDEPDAMLHTWHPRLPAPPDGFPEQVDFTLTHEEAEFLLDRVMTTQKDSLLAHLALRCTPAEVDFPWEHPKRVGFAPFHIELLEHARRFSEVTVGAALLYNLALAELAKRPELVSEHRASLAAWAQRLNLIDLRGWSLSRLWELTTHQSHLVKEPTRRFVSSWVEIATVKPETIADDAFARMLVQRREMSLKGARSRFTNARARDQWSGYAGTAQISYRWPTAKSFLRDLHAGLKGG